MRKFNKVYHVGNDVDNSPEHHGPTRCLVEGGAFIQLDEMIEGRAAKEGGEIPTNGKQNQGSVDV